MLFFCRCGCSSDATKENNSFDTYLLTSEVAAGLEANVLIRGVIRINQRNYKEAYINSPVGLQTYWKFFFLLFYRSPSWSMTSCPPFVLILWLCPEFLTRVIFRSSTESSHLVADLPTCLVLSDLWTVACWILEAHKQRRVVRQHKHTFCCWSCNTFHVFVHHQVNTVTELWGRHSGDCRQIFSGLWKSAVWWYIGLLQRTLLSP